jgi:uncharacterized damage-inducible protein DinB
MQTFFEEYLKRMQIGHEDIHKALEGLPPEALDWMPGPDTSTISVLIFHLTGAERYWIGDIAAQDPSHRDRDAEFKVHDVGIEALKKRLDDSLAYARKTLENFTLQDLEAPRTVPRDNSKTTVAGALLHALEHMTLHLGHIQITRQLWEQRAGRQEKP